MKRSQIIELAVAMILFYLVSAVLWWALEIVMYGAAQPRSVDDIIGLWFMYGIVEGYRMGRRHGKEE